ncbi:MarR family transcriptional regulator [Actinopolymorpha pittospori]|uniref:DNA-binding MarR family transcriptional regulator n=1 Tax=Actinopolymorpha pittospori TaxID=648752 RepID=A0A927MWU4_9ACTN|nr:DNA-binding MarR family transcriptional regulator [Actinopolymorpha pittospori]
MRPSEGLTGGADALGSDLAAEIAAAWERERPGTPVTSIGVVSRIWALAKAFGENRRRVLASAGVDAATLDLLSTLRRGGPPYSLTTRDITDRTLVTAGAVSQRVARAERQGLVRRRPAGDGSRAVWVELTTEGHAAVERTVDIVLGQEVELLTALDPDQQELLAELLRVLLHDVRTRFGEIPPTHVGT